MSNTGNVAPSATRSVAAMEIRVSKPDTKSVEKSGKGSEQLARIYSQYMHKTLANTKPTGDSYVLITKGGVRVDTGKFLNSSNGKTLLQEVRQIGGKPWRTVVVEKKK